MKKIAAFFDIDGTIVRESLLIEHFKRLIKYEIIDKSVWFNNVKHVYLQYENRYGDYHDYIKSLSEVSREKLAGFSVDYNKFISKQCIEKICERVYVFSRKQIEYHKSNGHLIFFISGSPDFLVGELAEKYGVTGFRATEYLFDENRKFTGKVNPMWDSYNKNIVCDEIIREYDIDADNSFAYGDTTGDLTMLNKFGNAYAINPSKKLLERIRNDEILSKKVNIIVERKDVIYKLNSDVEILK